MFNIISVIFFLLSFYGATQAEMLVGYCDIAAIFCPKKDNKPGLDIAYNHNTEAKLRYVSQ